MTWMRRLIWALVAAIAFAGTTRAGIPEGRDIPVKYSLPRDYGYFLGDVLEVSYTLQLPPGHVLNPEWNPGGRAAAESFEVKSRHIEHRRGRDAERYQISFVYQVFSAAEATKHFEIPAAKFSYGPKGNPGANASRLPAIPVLVSPLVFEGAAFQPPIRLIWNSPSPHHLRLIGVVLLLAGTIPFFFWERRRLRVYSPFRAAGKKISRTKDPVAALIFFRGALNKKAGKAIFPHNLTDFFETFPQARPYEREVEEMVGLSDEMVFNPQNSIPVEGLIPRICALAEKLKKAEKWA